MSYACWLCSSPPACPASISVRVSPVAVGTCAGSGGGSVCAGEAPLSFPPCSMHWPVRQFQPGAVYCPAARAWYLSFLPLCASVGIQSGWQGQWRRTPESLPNCGGGMTNMSLGAFSAVGTCRALSQCSNVTSARRPSLDSDYPRWECLVARLFVVVAAAGGGLRWRWLYVSCPALPTPAPLQGLLLFDALE